MPRIQCMSFFPFSCVFVSGLDVLAGQRPRSAAEKTPRTRTAPMRHLRRFDVHRGNCPGQLLLAGRTFAKLPRQQLTKHRSESMSSNMHTIGKFKTSPGRRSLTVRASHEIMSGITLPKPKNCLQLHPHQRIKSTEYRCLLLSSRHDRRQIRSWQN